MSTRHHRPGCRVLGSRVQRPLLLPLRPLAAVGRSAQRRRAAQDLYYPDARYKVRPEVTDPPTEIVTLDDYRRRHRLQRRDPDSQLLGSQVPFIALTDDHDYVNNAWMTYAENHNPNGKYPFTNPPNNPTYQGAGFDTTPYPEGDYYVRMQNAMDAWFSYMPIREGAAVVSGTANAGSWAADLLNITAKANALYPGPYWNAATGAPTAAYLSNNNQAVPGAAAPNVTALQRYRLGLQQRAFTFPGVATFALTEDRVAFRTSAQANDQNNYNDEPTATSFPAVKAAIANLPGPLPQNWPASSVAAVKNAYALSLTQMGGWFNCSVDAVDGGPRQARGPDLPCGLFCSGSASRPPRQTHLIDLTRLPSVHKVHLGRPRCRSELLEEPRESK